MASIPKSRKIAAEDFPEQKAWMPKLLSPLNQFFETIVSALSKGLTFKENFASESYSIDFDGRYPVLVSWNRPNKPNGLWVIDSRQKLTGIHSASAVYLSWSYTQSRQISITAISGVTASPLDKYVIKFIAIEG
jgi:hypothetical protein